MKTDEAVSGRRKCQSDKKTMRWWKDDVDAAMRRKKRAYKRWIKVQTSESRDVMSTLCKGGGERCSEEGQK